MKITGKKLFVKALRAEGVDTIFAYPGGVITDLLDELGKDGSIRIILPRHEQALIHAAEGYARATGKPAVCLVTSGPGATNTITGLADAFMDSVPLVLFTGQVATNLVGNDAFQEVDMVGICRNITKYATMITKREDLGRLIKEAFFIASSGKPGPVVLDFPKDIQVAEGDPEYPSSVSMRGYKPPEGVHIGQLKKAWKVLKNAKRPIILAGGGVNISGASREFTEFVEKTGVPVVSTVMGRGAIPTYHPLYVGDAGLHGSYSCNQAIAACDVLFSIGTRFNDRITGDLNEFAPNAQIVHIDIDSASISRNVVVDVPIVADAKTALAKLNEWAEHLDLMDWLRMIESWDNRYPMSMPKDIGLTPQAIVEGINDVFSEDEMIYTTDVGQHQMWTTQFLTLDEKKQLITSGGFGTMGFGFPAAIGAKLAHPEKTALCISGDGSFQMNMQEMATSVVEHAPVILCLMNNYNLGMVRQMQDIYYGKRYVATSLKTHEEDIRKGEPVYLPDFMKWADSYGIHHIRVTKREEIIPALEQARKQKDKSTLIEFLIREDELVLPMVKSGKATTDMIL